MLAPIEQKQVGFYGEELIAVLVQINERQEVYVPLRPICNLLGITWSGQRRRINRDPVLREEKRIVEIETQGGIQEMVCLPANIIPLMLSTLNQRRVRVDEDLLNQYHRDLYHAVTAAFNKRVLTRTERIYELAVAVVDANGESELESVIAELALVGRLGVIPRINTDNQDREIYLAQAEDGLCKIGLSVSAKSRIRALNRSRFDEVKLLHAFPADDAVEAERKLHSQYDTKRAWGEWFHLSQNDIQEVCSYEAYCLGQFIGGSA